MRHGVRPIFDEAQSNFRRTWPELAVTAILYKVVAFAVLTPLAGLLLRLLVSTSGSAVVADEEILFFLLRPVGLAGLWRRQPGDHRAGASLSDGGRLRCRARPAGHTARGAPLCRRAVAIGAVVGGAHHRPGAVDRGAVSRRRWRRVSVAADGVRHQLL